jgi:hypothetical protein
VFLQQEATEIVFYDVETTVPAYDMIEFGCVIVDKYRLIERFSYETLIYSDKINKRSVEGIFTFRKILMISKWNT